MNCSVWLVCGASAKAATVTASMAAIVRGFVSELDGHGVLLDSFLKI
jgi:hypothetical protein